MTVLTRDQARVSRRGVERLRADRATRRVAVDLGLPPAEPPAAA